MSKITLSGPGGKFTAKGKAKQPRNGRGQFHAPEEDPRHAALVARCRQTGKRPSYDNLKAARSPLWGSAMGRCLLALRADDAVSLMHVWNDLCAAERTYARVVLGIDPSPQSAALEILPEPVETEETLTPDTRDPDQRHRDAVNSWMDWQGYLGHLHARQSSLLRQATRDDEWMWRDAAPTPRGERAIEALERLAKVVEGK